MCITGNAPVRWTDTGISTYINARGSYQLACDGTAIGDAQTVTGSNAGVKTFAFASAVQGMTYNNCALRVTLNPGDFNIPSARLHPHRLYV